MRDDLDAAIRDLDPATTLTEHDRDPTSDVARQTRMRAANPDTSRRRGFWRRHRRGAILGGIGLVVATAGGVTATAFNLDQPPPGVSLTPGGPTGEAIAPNWPVNTAGQTYGDESGPILYEDRPDLILVVAGNGRMGYVERDLLDELTGANVSTPEEALEWQRQQDEAGPQPSIYIPVYQSDGTTQVGTFEIDRSGSSSIVGPSPESAP